MGESGITKRDRLQVDCFKSLFKTYRATGMKHYEALALAIGASRDDIAEIALAKDPNFYDKYNAMRRLRIKFEIALRKEKDFDTAYRIAVEAIEPKYPRILADNSEQFKELMFEWYLTLLVSRRRT